MRAKIIEEAEGHLFTIEECRAQCEVVPYDEDSDGNLSHPDDDLILGFLDAAVAHAEAFTGLSIAIRTYEVALDTFPLRSGAIEIPNPPLLTIEAFTTGDGTDIAEVTTDFLVDDYSQPARLRPVGSWPSVTESPNTIRIRYTAGYMLDSDGLGIPKNIKQAIMLTMADWYNNREDSNDKQTFTLTNGAEAILRPMRIRLGMA